MKSFCMHSCVFVCVDVSACLSVFLFFFQEESVKSLRNHKLTVLFLPQKKTETTGRKLNL